MLQRSRIVGPGGGSQRSRIVEGGGGTQRSRIEGAGFSSVVERWWLKLGTLVGFPATAGIFFSSQHQV